MTWWIDRAQHSVTISNNEKTTGKRTESTVGRRRKRTV